MEFRTQVPIERQDRHLIDYESKLFLVGSCFSESIGLKFEASGFQTKSNPLGILFHPLAIENFLTRAINEEKFELEELQKVNEIYCSLDAHSQFNHMNPREVLSKLNTALVETKYSLHNASYIFITLGTAWVYRFIETDSIVANCHKIPQKKFLKELLSAEEVINSLESIISLVSDINPNTNFVLTVSPVRHLKDGFVENNRSKSHLIAAVQEVVEQSGSCHYFPSYELILDELRDYRFFNSDMVHPSDQAIDYVWERFQETWLSKDAMNLLREIKSVKQGIAHRAFNPQSKQHLEFLKNLAIKKQDLIKRIPHLRF